MTFLHPAMLAFATAAAAPWVVHLLNRGRTRSVAWGAMMFLTPDASPGDYRSRLRGWGLLILRSTIIVAAAVAMARPVLPPGGWNWPTAGLRIGGPPTVMLVVDTSNAMSYSANNRSRFDQAREVSLQLLSNLEHASRVGLVTTTGSTDAIPPAADLAAVSARLTTLQPAAGDDDLAASLDRANKLIEAAGESDDRRIYVVCDRHAAAWKNASDAFTVKWHDRHHPTVVVIPVGGEEADNVAVDSIRMIDPPVVRDLPTTVEVIVRNLGPTVQIAVPVTVFTGGRTLAETVVQVPAKSQKSVRLTVRFLDSGSRVISAAIKSAGLTVDDRADAAVNVIDAIRVTHVTAPGGNGGPISLALAPYAAVNRRGPGDAAVTNISDDNWPADNFASTDVIIVDGGVPLSVNHAGEIEQFVLDGGGLLLTAGGGPNPIDAGLWHLLSSSPIGAVIASPARINSIDRRDKTWQFLADRPLPEITFPSHVQFSNPGADARVIAKFDGDTPAIIRVDPGRGRAMVVAGPAGGVDDDFVRSAIFLPWIQSAVHQLAASKVIDRTLTPWRPIVEKTTAQAEERNATVQLLPSGKRDPATVSRFEDGSEIRYTHTGVPGTYRLRYRANGKEIVENFVVTQPNSAVDLTTMTDVAWKSLKSRAGFAIAEADPASVTDAAARSGASREVWIEFVVLAALLSLIESVWAGRVFV